jgi:hypothetical protein
MTTFEPMTTERSESRNSLDSGASVAATIGSQNSIAGAPPSKLLHLDHLSSLDGSQSYQSTSSAGSTASGAQRRQPSSGRPDSIITRLSLTERDQISQTKNHSAEFSSTSFSHHLGDTRYQTQIPHLSNLPNTEDYWQEWIPASVESLYKSQDILSKTVVKKGGRGRYQLHIPARGSSRSPEAVHPESCSQDARSRRRYNTPTNNYYRPDRNHRDERAYSFVLSSEDLTAAFYRNSSRNSHREPGPNMNSNVSLRHQTSTSSNFSRPMHRHALSLGAEIDPSRGAALYRSHNLFPGVQCNLTVRSRQSNRRTHSVQSSTSSRSDTRSHHNFSRPRKHSNMSDSQSCQPGGFSEETEGYGIIWRDPFSLADEVGGDGQIDRSRYRVERSKSSSTNYSPEAFRKLHGGVIPNMDLGENNIGSSRTRPPLTSRTSPQYSKLSDPVRPLAIRERTRPEQVSRRASYSNATGISPVAEFYGSKFNSGYSDMQSISRTTSRNRTLSMDTKVCQVDGALSSPTRGSDATSDLPMTAGRADNVFYTYPPIERKRVDDFEFLNTIESSTRPYTPDKFAAEAIILNNNNNGTTRNSSQRSKKSMASFGGNSRKSISNSLHKNQIGAPSRNVLRKRNPLIHNAQANGANRMLPLRSSNTRSFQILRERLASRKWKDSSIDLTHTATTCSGPSRGIIAQNRITSDTMAGLPLSQPDRNIIFDLSRINPFLANEGKRMNESSVKNIKNFVGRKRRKQFRASGIRSSPDLVGHEKPSLGHYNPQTQINSISNISSCTVTSFADDDCTAAYYLSTIYSEGKQMIRQTFEDGWRAALEDLRDRREMEKTIRYGLAGKKVKMFMRGARPPGSEEAVADTSLRYHQPFKRKSGNSGDRKSGRQRKLRGSFWVSISRNPKSPLAESNGSILKTEKKSVFVELFDRSSYRLSRERTLTTTTIDNTNSDFQSHAKQKTYLGRRYFFMKKTRNYMGF